MKLIKYRMKGKGLYPKGRSFQLTHIRKTKNITNETLRKLARRGLVIETKD